MRHYDGLGPAGSRRRAEDERGVPLRRQLARLAAATARHGLVAFLADRDNPAFQTVLESQSLQAAALAKRSARLDVGNDMFELRQRAVWVHRAGNRSRLADGHVEFDHSHSICRYDQHTVVTRYTEVGEPVRDRIGSLIEL